MSSNQQLLLGEGAGGEPAVFVEDVFSTYLYTGTGASLPIVNGIDLSTEGGLVWTKSRTSAAQHKWYDSARGISFAIESNTTDANQTEVTGITSFNTTGYTYGTDGNTNSSGTNYVSWTFRKQPKFFDIVTYTGDGDYSATRLIAHNLGSAVGAIIVKPVSAAGDWKYTHRNGAVLLLNSTESENTAITLANGYPAANSTTTFALVPYSGSGSAINASGVTYVAYLFAHNAGGFGLAGTDNVISCGSYTTTAGGDATVNLGYEPQWLLRKRTDTAGNWFLADNMRGWAAQPGDQNYLLANTSAAEVNLANFQPCPTATGFELVGSTSSATFIYIAIRRGPMKVPTVGTSVYNAIARTGTGAAATVTGVGFPPDLAISKSLTTVDVGAAFDDRLRGATKDLRPNTTAIEATVATGLTSFNMDGISVGAMTASPQTWNWSGEPYINYFFVRAPGFFDEVCYTGTGVNTTQTHNLGAVPELMIVKKRDGGAADWGVYANNDNTDYLVLNTTAATADDNTYWNDTSPTSSVFSVGTSTAINNSGSTYVAYLFATCAGVSKVGTYTGTGTTQTINCGFTAGSRFVMIKRIDSTGDWYVWDSTRGIVAGDDPYFRMNLNSLEVTNTDYVDTAATGFEISSTAPAAINASAGTFIFLAIA